MADNGKFNIDLDIMLFEGGALIDALSSKSYGVILADRIAKADGEALAAEQAHFTIALNPIEAGMAINALRRGQSSLATSLGGRLEAKLNQLLQDNGIAYGGDQSQPLGSDQTPVSGTGLGEEPFAPGQDAPADDGASTDSQGGEPSNASADATSDDGRQSNTGL